MNNWLLTIEYDGRGFYGWQRQPHHRTVQEEIEEVLSTILREPVKVTGAGRTDAGVHALGQAANFKTGAAVDPARLRWQLNAVLDDGITIREISPVSDEFDARRSALWRTYTYRILNRPYPSPFWRPYSWWIAKDFNVGAAGSAAERLVGTHDFAGFTVAKDGPTTRDVKRVEIGPDACAQGMVRLTITANAFLHHMVRLIVGTVAEIGVGRLEPGVIEEVLATKDVRKAGSRAPAKGLCLERVEYPPS